MKKLRMEQINEIEYFGEAVIDGEKYTYKDYYYKSEIRKEGELFARIDNRQPLCVWDGGEAVWNEDRVEYV